MLTLGVALVFLGALYPVRCYCSQLGRKAEDYLEIKSVLEEINGKILDTGTDLSAIFSVSCGKDGRLREALIKCSRLGAREREQCIRELKLAVDGDDLNVFVGFFRAFGSVCPEEEKRKLLGLIERFVAAEAAAQKKAVDGKRAAMAIYASALASALLLSL